MTIHRRKARKSIYQLWEEFTPHLQGAHKLPCRIYHKCKAIPTTSEDAHSKQCGQEMAGCLYLSDSCVSQTPHELTPSPKKSNFKGKGSFPSVFGLCTEIEICLLSSCSIDRPESLQPCSPKAGWFCIFCRDQPSIKVHHFTTELIPLLSTEQRVQNIP